MNNHFVVNFKPSGFTLNVQAGETLGDAAKRQNIMLFGGQHQATCKITCQGILLEGKVEYDQSIPMLTDDERESGKIILCQAKPCSDLIIFSENIQIIPPVIPKKITYEVLDIELLSGDVYQVNLKSLENHSFDYRAGQYLEILHLDTSPKPFSIACAPRSDNTIELHIRYLPDNPFVIGLLEELKSAKQIRTTGPFGKSYLHLEPQVPLVLIAGGTGFAPIKAMLEELVRQQYQAPIYFYWGARTVADLYMKNIPEEVKQVLPNFHYIPVLSAAPVSDNWRGRTGLVHEAVLTDHPELSDCRVYASGPPEMVYAAQRAFISHGLEKANMFSDWFDYEERH